MLMTTPSLYAPFGLQKVDPTFDQQLLCQLLNVWPGPQIREMLGLVATVQHGWWRSCLSPAVRGSMLVYWWVAPAGTDQILRLLG